MTTSQNDSTDIWGGALNSLGANLTAARDNLVFLLEQESRARAQFNRLAQMEGMTLDRPKVDAMLENPYALIPTETDNEYLFVQVRLYRELPYVGWVLFEENGICVSRITRTIGFIAALPSDVRERIGWKEPEFDASFDASRDNVVVTRGSRDDFKKEFGAMLGKENAAGFAVKRGQWMGLLKRMLRRGIMPYSIKPIAPA